MLSCQEIWWPFFLHRSAKPCFCSAQPVGTGSPSRIHSSQFKSATSLPAWMQQEYNGPGVTTMRSYVECRKKMLKMENGRESAQKILLQASISYWPTGTMSFHITHQIIHCILYTILRHATSYYTSYYTSHHTLRHTWYRASHHTQAYDVIIYTTSLHIATSHFIIVDRCWIEGPGMPDEQSAR